MSKSKRQAKAKGEGKGATSAEGAEATERAGAEVTGVQVETTAGAGTDAPVPETSESEEGAWVEIGGSARGSDEGIELSAGLPSVAPACDVPEQQALATKARRRGRGAKGARSEITLAELAEKYLGHLERSGKSSGTCFSYKLELSLALEELGGETKVSQITSERVMLFFGSDRVMRTRSGREKSPLSIAKTQRVLRQALVYAVVGGFIEKAPLPEDAATH